MLHPTLLTYPLLSLLFYTTIAATIYKGDGTFYSPSVGLGSCGHLNQDSEHVAALAAGTMHLYNPSNPNNNPVCGHKVRVWNDAHPSKTVTVAIVDTCPGCHGKYDLDLSPAAFDVLANPDVGRIKISWEFAEPVTLKTGPFKGAVPAEKGAVHEKAVGDAGVAEQEVLSDVDGAESRDEL